MKMKAKRPYIFLIKATIIALIITVLPLPNYLIQASPFWVLLFYIYWLCYFSVQWRFFFALIIGLLLDILNGSLLGQNAIALILSSAFIINVKQSFYVSDRSTQQVYVFISGIIYLGILLLTQVLIQGFDFNWIVIIVPLTTSLFWPPIKLMLTKLKH
jgi:rod shape-determining protein MreD